jgi:threonine/homoserine/homoserine lactone efflux protein
MPDLLHQVIVIVGITFLVLISPGPDMIIVMRNTFVGGRPAGLKTAIGILAGNLVHISYCVAGIGWLISQSILAFSVLKYAGAAYLIYLGASSFRSDGNTLDANGLDDSRPGQSWFLQGFINNLLNPKGVLFYLGVFTIVITPATTTGATLILIGSMNIVCAAFWLFFVATLDHPMIRRSIVRFQGVTNRIFGTLLVAMGMRVAFLDR